MRILTIGGLRGFTSTCLVRSAVERGHRVTVLTRGGRAEYGRVVRDLPPGVEVLVGNRTDDLAWAEGRRWDAVVDFGAFHPDHVDAAANALRGRVGHYTLISTIVAYRQDPGVLDETSPLLDEPELDFTAAEVSRSLVQYGRGKVLAERRTPEFGAPVLVVRPGIIAGPADPLGHLEYWIDRWSRGGPIAVPGRPDAPVQFADSRDVATWLVEVIGRGETGTFNAAGPRDATTMAGLLAILARELGERDLVWLPSEWLTRRGVRSYGGPFFWQKPDDIRDPDEFWVSLRISDARARETGYRPRTAEETVRDTIAQFRARPDPATAAGAGWGPGFDEAATLEAWHREMRDE